MPKFTPDKMGFGQPNTPSTGTSIPNIPGMVASGGTINDYQSPDGNFYRAHIFYGSGELTITSASPPEGYGNNIQFLAVGGGGGGGANPDAGSGPRSGGGAGGLRTNASPTYPRNLPATCLAYPGSGTHTFNVTVGRGGWYGQAGNAPGTTQRGMGCAGQDTKIYTPTNPNIVTASGGGGGPGYPSPSGEGWGSPVANNIKGGSGAGGNYGSAAGVTLASPDGLSPTAQGYPGGGPSGPGGDGGGGAGGEGGDAEQTHSGGHGGSGVQVIIGGIPSWREGGGQGPGPTGLTNHWYAGGGGGGNGYPAGGGPAGEGYGGNKPAASKSTNGGFANFYNYAGGGDGADAPDDAPEPATVANQIGIMAQSAYPFSGGGGGGGSGAGSFNQPRYTSAGNGGPGICIMRYQIGAIGESPTAPNGQSAKATGGNISFYGGKVIHSFYNPGNFVTDAGFNETIEWVTVGGGGGGGGTMDGASFSDGAGGGGAGGFNTKSDSVSTPTSTSFAITVGRGGREIGPEFSGGLQGYVGEGSSVTFGAPSPTSEWGDIPGEYKSYGGGGGGCGGGPSYVSTGTAGASGGGGGGTHPTAPTGIAGGSASYPGSPVTQGYAGIASKQSAPQGGGAGGGAGGAATAPDSNYGGAVGGVGVQLPSTFHDPNQQIGAYKEPNTTWYWVCGGGGGGACHPPAGPYGGKSSAGGGQGGGRSPGNLNTYQQRMFTNPSFPYPQGDYSGPMACNGWAGQDGTGGGGGGSAGSSTAPFPAGGAPGGSGMVILAYPV